MRRSKPVPALLPRPRQWIGVAIDAAGAVLLVRQLVGWLSG